MITGLFIMIALNKIKIWYNHYGWIKKTIPINCSVLIGYVSKIPTRFSGRFNFIILSTTDYHCVILF